MCVEVCVRGNWCETVGELRRAVPCEIVPDPLYEHPPQDEHCLCGVDIPETLERAGVAFEQDENFDYHVKDGT